MRMRCRGPAVGDFVAGVMQGKIGVLGVVSE